MILKWIWRIIRIVLIAVGVTVLVAFLKLVLSGQIRHDMKKGYDCFARPSRTVLEINLMPTMFIREMTS